MDFNKLNNDIFAVGYGNNDEFGDSGFICIWNLKSPTQPELIRKINSSVLSVAFSL